MPDIKEVYEMVVKQSPPQPDALERQRKRQDAVRRNRRAGAVAAVIAIAAALALVFAVTRPAHDTGGPAGTGSGGPSTTPTMGAQIIGLDGVPIHQLPGSFVDAYGLQRSPISAALAYSRGSTGSGADGIATVIVAVGGSAQRLVGRSADAGDGHAGASWSPDGSRIAYSWNGDIYVMNADGTGQRRLTNAAAGQGNYRPVWSPNGDLIVYWGGSIAGGDGGAPNGEIYVITVNGGGTPTRLTNDHVSDYEPTWSPTGADIAYFHGGELWIMGADGAGEHRVASPDGGAWAPAWSPDGAKIAFLSFSGNAADGRPVMDVDVLTLSTGDVQATGAQVLTDGNGPQWVSDSALLINRYG